MVGGWAQKASTALKNGGDDVGGWNEPWASAFALRLRGLLGFESGEGRLVCRRMAWLTA